MEYPMYTVPLETLLTLTDFRSHEAKLDERKLSEHLDVF